VAARAWAITSSRRQATMARGSAASVSSRPSSRSVTCNGVLRPSAYAAAKSATVSPRKPGAREGWARAARSGGAMGWADAELCLGSAGNTLGASVRWTRRKASTPVSRKSPGASSARAGGHSSSPTAAARLAPVRRGVLVVFRS
jgi:hypothetical protein